MFYKSPATDNEISCVMYGIDGEVLAGTKILEEKLIQALNKDKFGIIDRIPHKFDPQGYTIVILLAKSHVAIHTYPEYNSLYFNLYSCRGEYNGKKTFDIMKEYLNPSNIDFVERRVFVDKYEQ